MRFFGQLALATAMATATVTAAAIPAAAQAAEAQPSAAFVEQYNAIAASLNAGDTTAAKATFETMTAGMQNEQERYLAGGIAKQIAQRTKPTDQALMEQGASYILASEATPAEERGPAALDAAFAAYNQKDYNSALSYAQQAEQINAVTPQLRFVSSLSQLALGRQSGFDGMRAAIEAAGAGDTVTEQWYALPAQYALDWNTAGLDANAQAQIDEELVYWTKQMASKYPNANNWRSAIGAFSNSLSSPSSELIEDLYRLRGYTGSLTLAGDYSKYLASVTRNDQVLSPNEALRWLNQGIEAGYITGSEPFVAEALSAARAGKAEDEQAAPSLERSAVSSNSANALAAVADRALDQGRYERAIELYDVAAAAGFDADLASLRKGVANYELGNMAAARAAFEAPGSAATSALGDYWILFLDQQASASAN